MGVGRGPTLYRTAVAILAMLLSATSIPMLAAFNFFLLIGGLQWPGEPPPSPSPWFFPFALLLILNVIAPVAFALKSRTYGWWVLAGTQGADVIIAIGALVLTGPWPPYYLSLAGGSLALGLLLVLRYSSLGVNPR